MTPPKNPASPQSAADDATGAKAYMVWSEKGLELNESSGFSLPEGEVPLLELPTSVKAKVGIGPQAQLYLSTYLNTFDNPLVAAFTKHFGRAIYRTFQGKDEGLMSGHPGPMNPEMFYQIGLILDDQGQQVLTADVDRIENAISLAVWHIPKAWGKIKFKGCEIPDSALTPGKRVSAKDAAASEDVPVAAVIAVVPLAKAPPATAPIADPPTTTPAVPPPAPPPPVAAAPAPPPAAPAPVPPATPSAPARVEEAIPVAPPHSADLESLEPVAAPAGVAPTAEPAAPEESAPDFAFVDLETIEEAPSSPAPGAPAAAPLPAPERALEPAPSPVLPGIEANAEIAPEDALSRLEEDAPLEAEPTAPVPAAERIASAPTEVRPAPTTTADEFDLIPQEHSLHPPGSFTDLLEPMPTTPRPISPVLPVSPALPVSDEEDVPTAQVVPIQAVPPAAEEQVEEKKPEPEGPPKLSPAVSRFLREHAGEEEPSAAPPASPAEQGSPVASSSPAPAPPATVAAEADASAEVGAPAEAEATASATPGDGKPTSRKKGPARTLTESMERVSRYLKKIAEELKGELKLMEWGFVIRIAALDAPPQAVSILLSRPDPEGDHWLRIQTVCGETDGKKYLEILRFNATSIYGGLSQRTIANHECLCMGTTQMLATADEEEVAKLVRHVLRTGARAAKLFCPPADAKPPVRKQKAQA